MFLYGFKFSGILMPQNRNFLVYFKQWLIKGK